MRKTAAFGAIMLCLSLSGNAVAADPWATAEYLWDKGGDVYIPPPADGSTAERADGQEPGEVEDGVSGRAVSWADVVRERRAMVGRLRSELAEQERKGIVAALEERGRARITMMTRIIENLPADKAEKIRSVLGIGAAPLDAPMSRRALGVLPREMWLLATDAELRAMGLSRNFVR